MAQSHLLQGVILEIPHNGVQLHHRIADRGSGCKGHPLTACQFVQILTLCKHIAGLLCIGLGDTCDVPHFCVEEHIFIEMRLVHKQTVNTQFLKCNYIILSRLVVQLLQLCFQCFLCFFHLLDRKTAAVLTPGICQGQRNVVDLTLNDGLLPFRGKRHSLKLRVSDHDGIVIAGCDTGAELLSIAGFKVLFRCHQHIGIGIEPQEVCAPLLRKVVRHHIEIFLRQAQPAALHAGSDHLEGLACTHAMRQQRIVAVQNVRHRIFLVRHQRDFRGHALKTNMTAIVLTGTNRIENPIVGRTQILTAV